MNNLQIDISDSDDSSNDNLQDSKVNEYLLSDENDRLTVYPIKYPKIWEWYKKQEAAIWFVEEVDLSRDYKDWIKLNENEQFFIKNILAFFAASDTIVNINLLERFMNDVKPLEARFAYGAQYAMEQRHSEAYSLMIETLIKDPNEKKKLFNAVKEIKCVKKKADWAFKWIESNVPFSYRAIAFCIVEGIFFSGAFAAIFWLKERNLLPGLCDFNNFISRDEGMHVDFGAFMYSELRDKMDDKKVYEIIKEAVDIEKEFITESLPCNLLGINSDSMSKYIEFVADKLLYDLGYNKIFNINKCPLEYMEKISMQTTKNFFESRNDAYQNSHIFDTSTKHDYYSKSDDF